MRLLNNCIVCNGELSKVGYLGKLYPSAFIESPEQTSKFVKTETWINWCDSCKNMQSPHVWDGETLFRDYYYNSGINSDMRASLLDIVQSVHAQDTYLMCDDSFNWLDIACNDGTMCKQVKESYPDSFVVGVDPAKVNHKGSDVFINDFFTANKVVGKLRSGDPEDNIDEIKFNIISCIAMMYDIEKIHEFIEDVKSLLKKDGTFIIQLMDLESRLRTYAIDDVCDEHLVCYSLECLDKLFKQHGLEIFDCEYNRTNCSSLRAYIGFPGVHERRQNVDQMIFFQKEHLTRNNMITWDERVGKRLADFMIYLNSQKALGKKLYLVGASTKANTVLQMCRITDKLIDSALELSSFKFGKYMLGSNIPIVSEKEHFNGKRDFSNEVYVIAIWAFKDGIVKNYQDYIRNGATICLGLPDLQVITKNNLEEHI